MLFCKLFSFQNIKGKVPLSQIDLVWREKINGSWMPLSLTSFVIKSLYLSLGSQSLSIRRFLKQFFFHSMEEIEDCVTTTQMKKQWQAGDFDPFRKHDFSEEDGDISAIRFKVIIKRIE